MQSGVREPALSGGLARVSDFTVATLSLAFAPIAHCVQGEPCSG